MLSCTRSVRWYDWWTYSGMFGCSGITGLSVLVVNHGPSRTIRWSVSAVRWACSLFSPTCCCCCWLDATVDDVTCWLSPLGKSFVERVRIYTHASHAAFYITLCGFVPDQNNLNRRTRIIGAVVNWQNIRLNWQWQVAVQVSIQLATSQFKVYLTSYYDVK